jgi:hypothetical protein
MACRRAFDLDLVACLLDRERPEWREFRDHYPRCPECAAEVRTWTELHTHPDPDHVEPAALLAFEDAPGTLATAERRRIGAHLEACASCRDELTTLRGTDVAQLVQGEGRPAPSSRRWRLPSLRGVLVHPAFAYGLVLVLVLPAAWPLVRDQVAPRPRAKPAVHAPAAGIAEEKVVPAPARELDAVGTPPLSDDADSPFEHEAPSQGAPSQGAPSREFFRSDALADAAAPRDEDRALAPAEPATESRRRALGGADQAVPAAPEPVRAQTKRSAAAKAAPDPMEKDTAWPTVMLDPQVDTVVSVTGPGLLVRMPIPTTALTAGLAEVRVRDRSGTREMRQQHFGPPAHVAEIRLPAAWLTPGTYRVELLLGGDEPVSSARLVITP